jgi:formylglycine-generating enzyme required for sulfatase activity
VKIMSSGGNYCIDSTEVTNAHYGAFLAAIQASPGSVTLGPGCPKQTNFTPVDPMDNTPVWPVAADDYPVVHVDWCDAYAYCAWAGKRLCGQIGGGSLVAQPNPVKTLDSYSQWHFACSAGGMLTYPYGNTYQPGACLGMGGGQIAPVASFPMCVGGYPGIYDMAGNVWEWLDDCTSNTDLMAFCSTFGGGFDSGQADLACLGHRYWTRIAGAADLGFRCCADL